MLKFRHPKLSATSSKAKNSRLIRSGVHDSHPPSNSNVQTFIAPLSTIPVSSLLVSLLSTSSKVKKDKRFIIKVTDEMYESIFGILFNNGVLKTGTLQKLERRLQDLQRKEPH
ncbi:unnamed protein product [Ambrosiozyma monospora]|uniref:Unnamed protein product n=1 Tax=Ambrosiozyma monospora TaxID=43982 RepID=A0A9W6YQL3_AMBMO|nr:unnamed protein product [Ambrosiozyma monospora]